MMDSAKQAWIIKIAEVAAAAGHIFPQMAAAEAALESNYGQSLLAREGLNLFGTKQHSHPIFGTLTLPTREFLNNHWTVVGADWVKYDTLEECFADRMGTLRRLRDVYPHYGLALIAPDVHTYIIEVSRTWSTDPARASKCLTIYGQYFPSASIPPNNSEDVSDAAMGSK